MVPFLTNQNLTIFTLSFTMLGQYVDIKISHIKIMKHTANDVKVNIQQIHGKTLNKTSRFKVSHIKYYQINRIIA